MLSRGIHGSLYSRLTDNFKSSGSEGMGLVRGDTIGSHQPPTLWMLSTLTVFVIAFAFLFDCAYYSTICGGCQGVSKNFFVHGSKMSKRNLDNKKNLGLSGCWVSSMQGVQGRSPCTKETPAGGVGIAKRHHGSEWMQPLAAGIQSRGVTEPQRDRPPTGVERASPPQPPMRRERNGAQLTAKLQFEALRRSLLHPKHAPQQRGVSEMINPSSSEPRRRP